MRTWSAPESGSSGSAGGFWFSCTLHTQGRGTCQRRLEVWVFCRSDADLCIGKALQVAFPKHLCQLEVARAHPTPD